MPKLSIITINYNNLDGLKRTVESVVNQTWQEFEYIIIDGGSTDGSAEYIESQSSHFDYWVSEPDNGIYNAMNKGIAKATGDYLVFMNSGDSYLSPNTLQLCQTVFDNFTADVYYGQIKFDNKNVENTVVYPSKLSLPFMKNKAINHQACFFSRKLLVNIGGYDEQYKLAADYHYYLKVYIAGKIFHPILFPIVKYDTLGISTLQMDEYRKEMDRIWRDTVPPFLFEAEYKYENLKKIMENSRILKFAFKIRELKIKFFNGK
jgi:glycosyltransferase involved in cell wall biosynthesis